MKTFVIDIDDTLIISDKAECGNCGRMKYIKPRPIKKEIEYCNTLYDIGHTIILYTGRNWDCYKITIDQLSLCGVKYHSIVMGKPQGIYIDADAKTSLKEFL